MAARRAAACAAGCVWVMLQRVFGWVWWRVLCVWYVTRVGWLSVVCVFVGCGGVCRELCVRVCDVARLFGLVQCGVCMGWVWWRVM